MKIETLGYLSSRLEAGVRRAFAPRQPTLPLPDVEEPLFARSPALAEAAERARVAVARNQERVRQRAAEYRAESDARARHAAQRGL
jgi:hypothetical protein